jgi:hypothetical protein
MFSFHRYIARNDQVQGNRPYCHFLRTFIRVIDYEPRQIPELVKDYDKFQVK